MKNFHFPIFLITALAFCLIFLAGFVAVKQQDLRYILDHEKEIAKEDVGPHNGGGKTTAYSFFKNFKGKITFRKRVLHPGSSIGYHLQNEQEIYYIMDGKGELKMNGETIPVSAGDALLTLPGSSHGLKPAGGDLTVMIVY